MNANVWHPPSLSPTSPGWYPASTRKTLGFWRFWDGSAWSSPVHEDDPESHWALAKAAPATLEKGDVIYWINCRSNSHV